MEQRPSELDDAYLEAVLVGGREEGELVLVDYDSSWPKVFDENRRRLVHALGEVARKIEHVGSTAVPGLAAKPIVDIMVTVDDPEDEQAYMGPLENAGYVLRVRETNHRMFRTQGRDVQVHIWRAGSDDEARHLLFRDQLRSNPADREAYEALKRSLAGRWRDVNYYAEAKGPFIKRVVETASNQPDAVSRTSPPSS
jgi:GrpB-like predicted nucleotidyltransferase (UPF0157 family)